MVVAENMEKAFPESLVVKSFTTDSEEAKEYSFRSSTNVLFENELVPLDVATDESKMKTFLSQKLSGS